MQKRIFGGRYGIQGIVAQGMKPGRERAGIKAVLLHKLLGRDRGKQNIAGIIHCENL